MIYLRKKLEYLITRSSLLMITNCHFKCFSGGIRQTNQEKEKSSEQSGEKRKLEIEQPLDKKIKVEMEDSAESDTTIELNTDIQEDLLSEDAIKTEYWDDVIADISSDTEKSPENQRYDLRADVSKWLDKYAVLERQSVLSSMQDLEGLETKYCLPDEIWLVEVIGLREVQRSITWAAENFRHIANEQQKLALAETLQSILQPQSCISELQFPNNRYVLMSIQIDRQLSNAAPLGIKSIRQLPGNLHKMLKHATDEDAELYTRRKIQESMESTLLVHSHGKADYHFLVCVGVLRLFCISLDTWFFQYDLSLKDLDTMARMLETTMKILDMLGDQHQQQAFILNLALYSSRERNTTVDFVLDKMKENLCAELEEVCAPQANNVNVKRIQNVICTMLPEEQRKPDLWYLMYSIKGQLHFLKQQNKVKTSSEETIDRLSSPMGELLELLGMTKYYPQKLKYEDVMMLRTDDFDGVNKKPVSHRDLPWYFMKHILALDSGTRENCSKGFSEEDDDTDSSDEDCPIHPLDLIYIIYLCADDFLRQELSDKMSMCQYAVPLILPSPLEKGSQHKDLILSWALQAITRNFYEGDRDNNESFIDIRAPVIACLNIGKEVTWKSKLVNKLLSQQQESFWHKGLLDGKSCKQIVSQGMVEVACYLPGAYDDNVFSFPVIFLNVRNDDSSQNNLTSHRLVAFSSICCIFVEHMDQDLFEFMQTKNIKEKVILIILYREGQDKESKRRYKNLQEVLNLGKHQVICKSMDESESVHGQLRKSIRHIVKAVSRSTSITDFVNHSQRDGKFEVDDKGCYIGRIAAESILKDVDECNAREQHSAKATILPCNADLKSRQEIAALDKELCRQRKIVPGNTTAQNYAFGIKEQKWQLQLKQLQYPISSTFSYFLQCLVGLNTEDRKYFLQSLKLGLNKRSTRMLQPLYEEYKKCRAADEIPDRDDKLNEIERKITHGSLGLEHFFR